jgi:hypothetical protein
MTSNKWMKRLQAMDGAVNTEINPFREENLVRSPSPSFNWIFGKAGGIPKGYSVISYGEAKAGKSISGYLLAGQLHKDDPEAIVVRFDTEMRSTLQQKGNWGIDYDRWISFDSNDPTTVFDTITNQIEPMLAEGAPIKMIIIDSLTMLSGLREGDAESISNVQMADRAAMVTKGLKRLLPVIRKYNILFYATAHMRANLDAGMYGPKLKASMAWMERHFFELYLQVSRDNSADGKSDILGNKLENDGVKDFKGNKEITGHKIYIKNAECSWGGAGRTAEITIDYEKGLINTHEEVFQLAVNLGLVDRPNNRTYVLDGKTYTSKADFLEALRDEATAKKVLERVYNRDL